MSTSVKRKTAKVRTPAPEPPKPLLRIFVAGKPVSVNAMYTAGRGRNRYAGRRLTPAAESWLQAVWAGTATHRPPHTALDTKKLRIRLEFYRVRANADVDNLIKLTADGVAYGLGINDKQFQEVSARKIAGKDYPQGAFIEVWEDGAA